jgi:uncharacterized protein YjiS (DUF1127 family)
MTNPATRIIDDEATASANLAVIEVAAPYSSSGRSEIPTIIPGRASAGNDASCEDPAISAHDAEPWARHALEANGFGDVATTDTASSARQTSYELYHATRADRSFTLGEIVVAAIQAALAMTRRAYARHRQRREARLAYSALQQLDDRTLRDLGFDRSELRSVAAEVTGEAARTRVRAQLRLQSPL